ncbi:MAG TPA: hypothetical protein VMX14_12865 [Anaerolineae bacterium]|nr:hypothetical protein [Anaerolineae bacterium]
MLRREGARWRKPRRDGGIPAAQCRLPQGRRARPEQQHPRLRHAPVTNLIRHKVPPTKIMTVTLHKSLDTLLAHAHELDRDEDPAEGYVDYGNEK